MSRSFVAGLLLLGCAEAPLVEGASCPCPSGYTCDEPTYKCVRAETLPGTGGAGGTTTPPAMPAACAEIGPSPLRRLTNREYHNTVRDLLGIAAAPTQVLREDHGGTFDTHAATENPVGSAVAEQLLEAAERFATDAVRGMGRLVPCDPQTAGEEACGAAFVDAFASRAYRRPVAPEEKEVLVTVLREGRAAGGFAEGIQRVVETVLQSPQFLYRVEVGRGPPSAGRVVPLTSWEVATRLSYLFTGSLPDNTLSSAAAAGGLQTREEVRAQAERLLLDARTLVTMVSFHSQWLDVAVAEDLPLDVRSVPGFTAAFPPILREGAERFINHVFNAGGDLELLLTSPLLFVNSTVAPFYGLQAPGLGLTPVAAPTSQRAGILTAPAVVARHAWRESHSPVGRGVWLRDRLLCERLPPPPPDVAFIPDPSPSFASMTTRERYTVATDHPACRMCHSLIHAVGFAFEHYDGFGRYRTMDNGKPVDASGNLDGVPFKDATELAGKLVASDKVKSCLAQQWLRFTFGRDPLPADQCTLDQARGEFVKSGLKLKSLPLAITQTDAFLHRRLDEGGGP